MTRFTALPRITASACRLCQVSARCVRFPRRFAVASAGASGHGQHEQRIWRSYSLRPSMSRTILELSRPIHPLLLLSPSP